MSCLFFTHWTTAVSCYLHAGLLVDLNDSRHLPHIMLHYPHDCCRLHGSVYFCISATECKLRQGWDKKKIKGKTSCHVTYFILMAYSVHSLLLCRTRYVLFSRSMSSTSAWYLSIGPANLNHTWATTTLKTAVHDWQEDVDSRRLSILK